MLPDSDGDSPRMATKSSPTAPSVSTDTDRGGLSMAAKSPAVATRSIQRRPEHHRTKMVEVTLTETPERQPFARYLRLPRLAPPVFAFRRRPDKPPPASLVPRFLVPGGTLFWCSTRFQPGAERRQSGCHVPMPACRNCPPTFANALGPDKAKRFPRGRDICCLKDQDRG